jgi:AhpD family alkylhydroperoxidase
MLPGFFKNTPKDVLPQMWPLFKKYQIGESVIPKKYREMMMLASAAATKCPYCQTYHREVAKMLGATDRELDELAVVVAGSAFWSKYYMYKIMITILLLKSFNRLENTCQNKNSQNGTIE